MVSGNEGRFEKKDKDSRASIVKEGTKTDVSRQVFKPP
jgi:hypothetical protein